MNIPLKELKRQLSGLDRTTEIVAYCRGPYCILSFEAVAELRRHGFNVRRLEDGLPELAGGRDAGRDRRRLMVAELLNIA